MGGKYMLRLMSEELATVETNLGEPWGPLQRDAPLEQSSEDYVCGKPPLTSVES